MKKSYCLLFLVLLGYGCDDGDLTLETIEFKDLTTQTCGDKNIIFKLNESEALLLEIAKTEFVNEPTDINFPKVINIDNSSVRVLYRGFNGKVGLDNICNTIPAPSGKMEVITTTTIKAGNIKGSTVITGYNHNIVFKNITFNIKNGTQVYETFPFGDYVTPATTLPFGFDKTVEQCIASKNIYNSNASESLTLENIDSNLILNEETPLKAPRTALIGLDKNRLYYRLYSNGILTPDYFCKTTVPIFPAVSDEWFGASGVEKLSGIIEVSTIKSGTTAFKHTIVIKKAKLQKGKKSFELGDEYLYGELITL
jgi:hypothetical protein